MSVTLNDRELGLAMSPGSSNRTSRVEMSLWLSNDSSEPEKRNAWIDPVTDPAGRGSPFLRIPYPLPEKEFCVPYSSDVTVISSLGVLNASIPTRRGIAAVPSPASS